MMVIMFFDIIKNIMYRDIKAMYIFSNKRFKMKIDFKYHIHLK